MTDWPPDIEACKNCTGEPSRYSYGARGCCNRCYRLMKRIDEVRAWNRGYPATLKRIPKDGSFDPAVGYSKSTRLITDGLTEEQFEICREEHIRQLGRRLELLRSQEEIRRHEVPVDAWSLEQKFAQLLRLIRRKAEYPHNASYLNMHFSESERRVIYALLEEIIEQAPWHGIDWSPVFERIYLAE
jgi:hypothetical protein